MNDSWCHVTTELDSPLRGKDRSEDTYMSLCLGIMSAEENGVYCAQQRRT